MKYIKYFLIKLKKCLKGIAVALAPFAFFIIFFLLSFIAEGYTWEDFGLDGFSLNPNDYCNLTDVEYTAVLRNDSQASVEITEYLTFDVHAASKSNTFKEL